MAESDRRARIASRFPTARDRRSLASRPFAQERLLLPRAGERPITKGHERRPNVPYASSQGAYRTDGWDSAELMDDGYAGR